MAELPCHENKIAIPNKNVGICPGNIKMQQSPCIIKNGNLKTENDSILYSRLLGSGNQLCTRGVLDSESGMMVNLKIVKLIRKEGFHDLVCPSQPGMCYIQTADELAGHMKEARITRL